MNRKILCGAAAMLCAALLAACSQTSAASTASSSAPVSWAPVSSAEMPATAAKIIGTQADGVEPITLENKTGKEITGFSVKSSDETAYPANMLPQGETFAAGEKRDLYYAIPSTAGISDAQSVSMPAENADAASSAGESRDPDASSTASAKALPPQYDVQLTFADKTTAVLHAFPFGDTAQGSICQEDGVTFLTYLSTSSNEEVSTKDAEQKLLEDASASSTPESSEPAVSSSAPASSKAAEKSEDTTTTQKTQETDTEPASKPKTTAKPKTSTTSKPKSTPKASSEPKTSSKPKTTTPDTNQGTTQTPNTTTGGNSDDGCLNGGLLW